MSGLELLAAALLAPAPASPADRIRPDVPRPRVTIARVPGDPARVRVSVTNAMLRPISFALDGFGRTARFALADADGTPVELPRRRRTTPYTAPRPKPVPP